MSLLNESANKDQLIEILNSMYFPIMGAGGGFAPIGTESYVEGTIAPDGWLICDGSVLNIADYPDLATYYASHFGASNYFGGDGITTFALPTREGMPNNNDGIYSEEEHVVGVWKETIDGVVKQKPVYEKTLLYSNNNGIPISTVIGTLPISSRSYIVDAHGATYQKTEEILTSLDTGNKYWFENLSIDSSGNVIISGDQAYITDVKALFRYIKPDDSWTLPTLGHSADGLGVFCVKATVAGDPNAHQYSTEEQVVSYDTDGSEIYEITFRDDAGLTFPLDISSLSASKLKKFDRVIGKNGVNQWDLSLLNASVDFYTGNNMSAIYVSSALGDLKITEITIQYTKTS